jgi:hypothetical protein
MPYPIILTSNVFTSKLKKKMLELIILAFLYVKLRKINTGTNSFGIFTSKNEKKYQN